MTQFVYQVPLICIKNLVQNLLAYQLAEIKQDSIESSSDLESYKSQKEEEKKKNTGTEIKKKISNTKKNLFTENGASYQSIPSALAETKRTKKANRIIFFNPSFSYQTILVESDE